MMHLLEYETKTNIKDVDVDTEDDGCREDDDDRISIPLFLSAAPLSPTSAAVAMEQKEHDDDRLLIHAPIEDVMDGDDAYAVPLMDEFTTTTTIVIDGDDIDLLLSGLLSSTVTADSKEEMEPPRPPSLSVVCIMCSLKRTRR